MPDIQVVDLATPIAAPSREAVAQNPDHPLATPVARNRRHIIRPLEVDLTCEHDIDDELVVVLEDIMTRPVPSRAVDSPLPVILGTSPPRRRPVNLSSQGTRYPFLNKQMETSPLYNYLYHTIRKYCGKGM